MRTVRQYAAVLMLVGLLAGPVLATTAEASCAEDSGPDGSEVIFVGTMEEERRGFSRLTVKEVWAGPDLADEVWVRSGQEQARWPFYFLISVGSSNDADYEIGQDYVIGTSKQFISGACSSGTLASDATRPLDARPATSDGLTGANPPAPTWLGIVGLLAFPAALIAGLKYRKQSRRRRRQSAETSQPDD